MAEAEVSESLSRKTFDLSAECDKLKEEVAGLTKLREECDSLRADLAVKMEVADTFERQASKSDEMYSQQFTEWSKLNDEYDRLWAVLKAEILASQSSMQEASMLRTERDRLMELVFKWHGMVTLQEECRRLRADLAMKTEDSNNLRAEFDGAGRFLGQDE